MTSMKISVRDGRNISFPFELKDSFRSIFKSAKWNPQYKEWRVAKGAEERLADWVREIENSGVLQDMELQETARLSELEIQALSVEIQQLKAKIASEQVSVQSVDHKTEQARKLRAEIGELGDRFCTQQKVRAEALERKASATAEIMEILGTVADVDKIESLLRGMRKDWYFLKAVNKGRFEQKQEHLEEIRVDLESAGIRAEAIDLAVEANFNRPDRDEPDLSVELVFERIPEPEPESELKPDSESVFESGPESESESKPEHENIVESGVESCAGSTDDPSGP